MLPKPKRHKNNKESYLQNLYPTILKQSSNAIRVKFSRYKQNQIFTNVSFDTLILYHKISAALDYEICLTANSDNSK